jgi:hypothetical protein
MDGKDNTRLAPCNVPGVLPLLRPAPSASHSAFSATGCLLHLSDRDPPASPSSFRFLVALEPSTHFLASTLPARVAHPSVWHVLSPMMASQGHSLGPSSPSPFDPASKQTNRLLSLSSSLHRFENPPKLKLPGFSFSCWMTPEHQISINRGIKTCFPLSRLSLHRSQKYPPKVSDQLFPRLW